MDLGWAMLSVLAAWLLLAAAVTGMGLGLRVLVRAGRVDRAGELLTAAWTGFALLLLFLQLWHLAFPIRSAAALVVAVLGTAGWFLGRPQLVSERSRRLGEWLPLLLIAALVVLWVANLGLARPTASDTGIYHLPAVAWAKAYPVVPGLANLHGRLGFNNSSLLVAALLDQGPWVGRVTHLMNGFVIALFFVTLLARVAQGREPSADPRPAAFAIVLLIPVTLLATDPFFVSSLTTDLPASLLLLMAFGLAYQRLIRPPDAAYPAPAELAAIVLCATAAVSVKLSVAVPVAILVLLLLWRECAATSMAEALGRPVVRWVSALVMLFGLSWATRSVILTGYPAYPSTFGAIPVSWRVPLEQAEAERDWVYHFARINYRNFAADGTGRWVTDWSWLRAWFTGTLATSEGQWQVLLPLGLALIALVVAMLRRGSARPRAGAWLLVPIGVGLAFWFVTAPRAVFALALFWTLTALAVAEAVGPVGTPSLRRGLLVAALLSSTLPVLVRSWQRVDGKATRLVAQLKRDAVVRFGSDQGYQPVPVATLAPFRTASGLELQVPVANDRCWAAPPLCTPHPAVNLRLRRPETPSAGFMVDGPWQAQRWPTYRSDFLVSWRAVRLAHVGGRP